MKKAGFIFLMVVVIYGTSLSQDQRPKYLPVNEAETYIDLQVIKTEDCNLIEWQSLENVRNYTFYVIRGTLNSNSEITWEIIAEIENPDKKIFRQRYEDKVAGGSVFYYRLMVLDDEQNIEYTSIVDLS